MALRKSRLAKEPEPSGEIKQAATMWLKKRGVELTEIANLVYEIQKGYIPDLETKDCLESVERVLEKREVQYAILTGLSLDTLAEKGLIEEPLLSTLWRDDGLFGIDEILALSVVNVYGSIGLTNFGYLDKLKPGVIGELNRNKGERVNTFLDDLVAAIAAAAAGRIAHRHRDGTLRQRPC